MSSYLRDNYRNSLRVFHDDITIIEPYEILHKK